MPISKARDEAALVAAEGFERSLHILIVDNQPTLCELLANFLENDLHTVETAESAQQALQKFKAGTFDLVITDHIMTEMNGEQLTAALKAQDATVPIILLNGFGDSRRTESERLSAVDVVVAKPFSRSGLRQAMMQVVRTTSSQEHKEQNVL